MIRSAEPKDAARFSEIYRPYVEAAEVSFEAAAPNEEELLRRMDSFMAVYPWLVLEENGVLLGYAYAHRYRERAAFDWVVETSIYLAPEAKHTGAGERLYRRLMDVLRAQGVCLAYAFVRVPNAESEQFHLKFGFTLEAVQKWIGFKHGKWQDMAVLRYELSKPPETPPPLRTAREVMDLFDEKEGTQ